MVDNQMAGRANIFLLRFGIYVDPTTALSITEVEYAGRRYRFYPPFRDKPLAEELRGQAFDLTTIPVRPNRRSKLVLSGLLPPPFVDLSLSEPAGPEARGPRIMVAGRLEHLELPPPDAQPRNRFRVDVYGPALKDPQDTLSREFARFLALLRWRTGQWWIGRSGEGIGVTTTFAVPINAAGDPVDTSELFSWRVNISGVPPYTRAVGEDVWNQTVEDFAAGRSIPLNALLMLDARYFSAIGDIRQALLNAAAGVENLKEAAAERLWAVRNPGQIYTKSQRNKLFRGPIAPFIPAFSLPRHIDESFQAAFGRSYRREHPAEWQGVSDLWDARNSVAHGDLPKFGSPTVDVTSHLLADLLRVAEHCAAWLASL